MTGRSLQYLPLINRTILRPSERFIMALAFTSLLPPPPQTFPPMTHSGSQLFPPVWRRWAFLEPHTGRASGTGHTRSAMLDTLPLELIVLKSLVPSLPQGVSPMHAARMQRRQHRRCTDAEGKCYFRHTFTAPIMHTGTANSQRGTEPNVCPTGDDSRRPPAPSAIPSRWS